MNDIFIRELRFSEILAAAFGVFVKNLKLAAPLCLAVFLPLYTIESFIPESYSAAELLLNPDAFSSSGEIGKMLLFSFAMQFISICFTSLIMGGLTYIAISSAKGEKPTAAGVLDFSIMKWHRLAFTAIIYYLLVSVSAVLIIPALYFAVSLVFYDSITASTNEWGVRALIRSLGLVRRRFLKTAGFLLALTALTLLASTLAISLFDAIIPEVSEPALRRAVYIVTDSASATLCSVFTLAQAIWFVNISAVRGETKSA